MRFQYHRFGQFLGARIGPLRTEFAYFVDGHARLGRGVHQHGAGVDELLHVKLGQGVQEAPRALDVDLTVSRVLLAGKIIVGSQVDHGGDAPAILFAKAVHGAGEGRVRADIGLQAVLRVRGARAF